MAKKLKAKHLYDLTFISDAQLSPDGKQVAVVQTTVHEPEGDAPPEYRSHIFLYAASGGEGVQLTREGRANQNPRFSPDGSALAFTTRRGEEEQPQLYLLPLGGGEARALTSFKTGVSEFVWHPSSTKLALVSRGDAEDTVGKRGEGRLIDRLFYKGDGVGFRPSEPAQLYLHDLATGESERLTKLQAGPSAPAFSPDGTRLYFTAARDEGAEDAWLRDLWMLELAGGKAQRLESGLPRVLAAVPSPDGRQLALLAPTDGRNFATPTGLWRLDADGGEAVLLTGEHDAVPSIGGDSQYGGYPNLPSWADDGESVFFNLNREGRSGLAQVTLAGALRPVQRGERAVSGFHRAAGRTAFTAETPSRPGELFVRDARGRETQLSFTNQGFAETHRLSEASSVRYAKAKGGPRVAYWTLEPRKARKDRALVLQVHGGPHTNYGYGFSFEFQLLAAKGYTVVYGNPRGSSSYGTHFATTAQGRYGTVDADDVLAIAHAARRAHPKADAPIHLTGGSYGGFMTNWLVTQTELFTSAVTQRSICNWASFYGTSDIGYNFAALEVAGAPWSDPDKLWAQSPLKYVANVTTPLLIIHAEEDHRCPIEQAEQLFVALKSLGKTTQFLRFPSEGHELSRSGRPDRRVRRLEAIAGWFERHG